MLFLFSIGSETYPTLVGSMECTYFSAGASGGSDENEFGTCFYSDRSERSSACPSFCFPIGSRWDRCRINRQAFLGF